MGAKRGTVRPGIPFIPLASSAKHSRLGLNCSIISAAMASIRLFALLRELNGKIAVLDIEEQGSMTFITHVEKCVRCLPDL